MNAQRYAIVLGAAVWPDEHPSPTLERRAKRAAALWHEGRVNMIIGSGGVGKHSPSEAEMIHRICVREGVPAKAIALEAQARNTQQNLEFSRTLIPSPEQSEVIIVSDIYHLPRALMTARLLGLNARGAATPLRSARKRTLLVGSLREIPAIGLYAIRNIGRKKR